MSKCNKSVYLANKNIDMIDAVNKGYIEGYNKAIDDFTEAVKELIVDLSVIRFKDIDEIAEQLKEGTSNETYNQ